ncbi:Dynamin family protein [Anaerovirgula multivorans]|uniref:Dynamin family protein n=1 Tax=Anaerovirgula multivorans TaxID=312168 RepID=A0A239GN15_9FIRM|nr:dynamin family protein [Anaerovirgula multivorans]SNS70148.1 Dynamin family protein [Anaerovirgula multivorans]
MNEIDLIEKINKQLLRKHDRYKSDIEWLNSRRIHWEKDRIRIGVVGVTSSGKSTLINAILGSKLLSEAVRPSSSQLVCCSYGPTSKMTVYLQDGNKKEFSGKKLTPDIVKVYTDEAYNVNNKENVKQVELSTPYFDLGQDILLVDSPGLDAYKLEIHEKLTLETLIPTIDVCIFVTTFKTNSDYKMKSFLNIIAKFNCPVIIVQNMYDSLRPSLDGLKTVDDVAEDHRKRVQRIIDGSDIKDKSLCQIVQMSAVESMKGRCNRKKHNERKYNRFVDTVKWIVNTQKPRIKSQRFRTIGEKVWRLIKQEEDFIATNKNQLVQRFVYEHVEGNIKKEYENALKKIHYQLKQVSDYKIIEAMKRENAINEFFVDRVRDSISSIEKAVSQEILSFNERLYKIIDSLNIARRDAISFNGLPNIPNATVKKKQKTRPVRVEKKSFGSGVARFFGDLFNNDWGYEYEEESYSVVDEDETEKSLRKFIDRVYEQYGKTIKKWNDATCGTLKNIEAAIILERQSYNQKLNLHMDSKAVSHIVRDLKLILNNMNSVCKIDNDLNSLPICSNEVHEIKNEIEVSDTVFEIHKLAKLLISLVNKTTIDSLLGYKESDGFENIIVSWDQNASDEFYDRFFRTYDMPCKMMVNTEASTIKLPNVQATRNLFIMFNAIQTGAAKNQLHKSKLLKQIKKDDVLIFVAQDFNELINGNVVSEGLREMILLKNEFNIDNKVSYMINHENPVYNMVFVENQIIPCLTIIEETETLKAIQKKFSMFWSPKVSDAISDIIRI